MKTKLALFAAVVIVLALTGFGPSRLDEAATLLPPVVAIGLALITREVLVSLFLGIYAGAVVLIGFDGVLSVPGTLLSGLLRSVDTHILNGLIDKGHATIIVFSLCIGGMVGVVARSGGLQGIVAVMARKADSPIWSQMSTYAMGLVIFFDDYANTLIVGNTLRPLTDRARVSREKLSFIVDATAAPIASVAVLSAWIGYEVGLIGDAFEKAGITTDPYLVFLESLPYRFYAFLLLFFIPAGIFLKREFGPMLTAERRARRTGEVIRPGSNPLAGEELEKLQAPEGKPLRWYNAALPILTLILTTLIGLIYTGRQAIFDAGGAEALQAAGIRDILGQADSTVVLLWAAILSSVAALVLVSAQGILDFEEAMKAWVSGAKAMVLAMFILALAWGLGAVVEQLGTATTVSDMIGDKLPYGLLPAAIFVASGVIAFATGTSWGTMAILFPITIPLVVKLSGANPAVVDPGYLAAAVGAILTGAIFGDHCSPISDTTVMSSMASAVDHMDHVWTQMPYAASIGLIALLTGYLPSGYGVNPYLANLAGAGAILAFLFVFGRDPDQPPKPAEQDLPTVG